LTAFPVFVVLGNPSLSQSAIYWPDYVGLSIWIFGFGFQTVADYQKQVFKSKNPADFISTGLFAYCRYPNYFGEVVLWFGVFIICQSGFVESWQWVTIVSPFFVFFLIFYVSGVALSEKNSEARYGTRMEFKSYKAHTPLFFPWLSNKLILGATYQKPQEIRINK
jgi:steroid 5-alpha reductase family enzyme